MTQQQKHAQQLSDEYAEKFRKANTWPPTENVAEVDYTANDDSHFALIAAAHNFAILKPDWCKCSQAARSKMAAQSQAYYRDALTGSHGWMCGECHGIRQTG